MDLRSSFLNKEGLIGEASLYRRCGSFVYRLLEVEKAGSYRDIFEIEGISLWNAIAPLLAAFILPEGVLWYTRKGKTRYSLEYRLLRRIKRNVKQFLGVLNREDNKGYRETPREAKEGGGVIQKPILFLNFTAKHFAETFSNVSDLLKKEDYTVKVIGEYEPSIPEADFYDVSMVNSEYEEVLKEKSHQFQERIWGLEHRDFFDDLKREFPLIWKVFADNLKELVEHIFPNIALRIVAANRVISSLRPIGVTGGDDCDYRARVHFLAARKEKIPTLLIQQGLTSYKTVDFMHLSTDRVAVIGEESFEELLGLGVERERMIITGRPGFDDLVKEDGNEKVVESLKMGKASKYILFTSQPFVVGAFKSLQSRNRIIENIYSISSLDMPIVIKPHPGEDMKFHRKLAKKYPHAILAAKDSDTNQLIKQCEIFMTCSSTTALQAMIAEKPVVIVNFEGCSEHTPYYQISVTLRVDSPDELIRTARYAFDNRDEVLLKSQQERNSFVMRNTYLPDGKASERVKDIIVEMTGTKALNVL